MQAKKGWKPEKGRPEVPRTGSGPGEKLLDRPGEVTLILSYVAFSTRLKPLSPPAGVFMRPSQAVARVVLTTPEVLRAFEPLSNSTLNYYAKTGLISPLKQGAPGRFADGVRPSMWGWRELRRLALARHLRSRRLSLQAVRRVLDFVEGQNYRPEQVFFRVRLGPGSMATDVEIVEKNVTLSALASPGQTILRFNIRAVPVREIVREAEKKIAALKAA